MFTVASQGKYGLRCYGLYLSLAGAAVVSDFIGKVDSRLVVLTAIVGAAVAGGFTLWQLNNRASAANLVAICVNRLREGAKLQYQEFVARRPGLAISATISLGVIIVSMLAVIMRAVLR